jgi:rhodanese-related sulfurtransferase
MTSPRTISVDAFSDRLTAGECIQTVDVRSASEFDSGHIPGAINIPAESLLSRLPDLNLSAPTLLVCHSGDRARVACDSVGQRFLDVAVLDGGTKAWIQHGRDVVRTTKVGMSLVSQSMLGAGLINLIGVLLTLSFHPAWIGINAFVSIGLILAGSTGFCMMALILAKMPWNNPSRVHPKVKSVSK